MDLNLFCHYVFHCTLFVFLYEYIIRNAIVWLNFPVFERSFFYSFFIFGLLFRVFQYYKSLPPGPWGVPLLGYLPFMYGKQPDKMYLEMSKKYGDVFSVQLGSNLIVCLGSTKLMKQFFNRPDSTARPHTPLNGLLGGFGIMMSEGTLWKRQRLFLHEKFQALGVNLGPNQKFEKYVIMEIEELLNQLHQIQLIPTYPSDILGRYVHNVICQLIMSFRFEENDEEFTWFHERVFEIMELNEVVHIGEHIKEYLNFPGMKAVMQEIKMNLEDISQFHSCQITERIKHRRGSRKSYKAADLLDHYLEQIETRDKSGKSDIFPDVDPEKQIVQVMNDLFSAGMETTLTSLIWTLLMMVMKPEVADKVREELWKVVAPGNLVTLGHRLQLPYTEAVLYETMRMVSVVPLGTTHVNTEPWKIDKYTIPAGTHIIPLINKMNMDGRIFHSPYRFIPERFITNGYFHTTDNFMQFGFGQRSCIGRTLARMELFLFFANIMNHFDFTIPYGENAPELEGVLETTLNKPVPYKLVFKKLDY